MRTKNNIENNIFKERIHTLCSFFNYGENTGWDTVIQASQNIALAWIYKKDINSSVPLHYAENENLYIATQRPVGISAYVKNAHMYSGYYLKEIWDILSSNSSVACNICPPQTLIALDVEKNSLSLLTDCLGLSRLYTLKTDTFSAWTNFAPLLPFVTQNPLKASRDGWASYAGVRTFMRGTTPYANVSEVRHGNIIDIDGESGVEKSTYYTSEIFNLKADTECTDSLYEEIAADLSFFVHDVDRLVNGELQIDLTGGRDSRLIAAYAIKENMDCTFHTAHPPQLEWDIAKQLLAAVNIKGKHISIQPKIQCGQKFPLYPLTNELIDYYIKFFHSNFCGMNDSGSIRPQLYPKSIGGAAGEYVQSNHYSLKQVSEKVVPELYLENYINRFLHQKTLIQPITKSICQNIIDTHIRKAQIGGLTGFYVQDYLLGHVIHGRLYSLDSNMSTNKFTYTPLYKFFKNGFSMPIKDKVTTRFQRTLTSNAIAEWKEIPYYHEIATSQDNRYFSYSLVWDDIKILSGIKDIVYDRDLHSDIYDLAKIRSFLDKREWESLPMHILISNNEAILRLIRNIAHDIFLAKLNDAALLN